MDTSSIPLLKRCKTCGALKSPTREFFHKSTRHKDGLFSECKDCMNAKARSDYPRRKDAIQASGRLWRQRNPDKWKRKNDEWRLNHPERVRELGRNWYHRHPEQSKALSRKYRRENPEKVRESRRAYAKANPEKIRARTLTRIARKKGAEGHYSGLDVKNLYSEQDGLCAYCGIRLFEKYHVEHVAPLSRGGSNWVTNLVLTCQDCNLSKHDKLLSEWEQVRGW